VRKLTITIGLSVLLLGEAANAAQTDPASDGAAASAQGGTGTSGASAQGSKGHSGRR